MLTKCHTNCPQNFLQIKLPNPTSAFWGGKTVMNKLWVKMYFKYESNKFLAKSLSLSFSIVFFCLLFDIFSSAWKWFWWSSTSEVIVIVKYVQTHRIPLIAMGKDSKSRFISVLKMSFQIFLRILLKVKPLLKGWRTCRRDSHWPPERRVLALFVKSFTHCQLSPTLHCQIRFGNQSSRFFTLRSALLIGVPCRTDICKNKCFTISPVISFICTITQCFTI